MINLKTIILDSKKLTDGRFHVYIQFSKDRKTLRINTGIIVDEKNFENGKVIGGDGRDPNADIKNSQLSNRIAKYDRILLSNASEVDHLTVHQIKDLLINETIRKPDDYFKFVENRIAELEHLKIKGSIDPLKYSRDCVSKYWKLPKLEFTKIDNNFLQGLQKFYKDKGLSQNSIALILRYIRIIYNLAFKKYNTDPMHPIIPLSPFNDFKIVTADTEHRNLSIEDIRKIIAYQPTKQRQIIAKDCWVLQLLTFGLNAVDLFYLRPNAVKNGRLKGNRQKTGKLYNIKIEPEIDRLLKKYKGEKYLLRFADNIGVKTSAGGRGSNEQWRDNEAFRKMINEGMQAIQKDLGIEPDRNITTYFSRHSFSSLLYELEISEDVISQALTHKKADKNMKVTGGYINKDWVRCDQANRKLIDYVFKVENVEPDYTI